MPSLFPLCLLVFLLGVSPKPSELAYDFQSFSSVLCFLLSFMKTSANCSCLVMKMCSIPCQAKSFAFSSSPPLVSLATAEYSILPALVGFISSSSIYFKALKGKDHVLFVFLSVVISTMSYSKIMLNTSKGQKKKRKNKRKETRFFSIMSFWNATVSLNLTC